jgi:hypothetical protein
MRMIDERGRLFGRVNVIDAAVAVVALAIVPVAIGAALLFRTPAPTVTAIEPVTVAAGTEMRIKVKGEHLRPLLRATIGGTDATAYLFENSRSVDVLFSGVEPGTHDVALYDGVQELVRVPRAVTVLAAAGGDRAAVQVTGRFLGLTEKHAGALRVGQQLPPTGEPMAEILALGPVRPHAQWIHATDVNVAVPATGRVERAAVLRVRCTIVANECRFGGKAIGTRVSLTLASDVSALDFTIDEVRPDVVSHTAELLLRFVGRSEVADLVRPGDRDGLEGAIPERTAEILRLKERARLAGQTSLQVREAGEVFSETRTPDDVTALEVVLRVPVDPSPAGWTYRGQILRAGAPFSFVTPAYVLRGSILKIAVQP